MHLNLRLLGVEILDLKLADSDEVETTDESTLSLGGTVSSDRIGFHNPGHHPEWDQGIEES